MWAERGRHSDKERREQNQPAMGVEGRVRGRGGQWRREGVREQRGKFQQVRLRDLDYLVGKFLNVFHSASPRKGEFRMVRLAYRGLKGRQMKGINY